MDPVTLSHYTAAPFTLDRDRTYEQTPQMHNGKPRGLWVSVDGEDDWPAWCRSEEFAVGTLTHRTVISLSLAANVLHLSTEEEMIRFDRDYGHPGRPGYPGASIFREIDWALAARRWDGLIIAPYQWGLRLELMWFYGWDCASGCIWNLDAIEAAIDIAPPTGEIELPPPPVPLIEGEPSA